MGSTSLSQSLTIATANSIIIKELSLCVSWHSVMQITSLPMWTLDSMDQMLMGGGVSTFCFWFKISQERSEYAPPPKSLENAPQIGPLPHCIVADEAFPLRIDLMHPYPCQNKNQNLPQDRAIFNYRLSRARRIVENCFGIFAQRWRIFMRRIQLDPENVTEVIKACCVLHNFLRETPEYRDRGTLRINDDGSVLIPQGGPIVNVAYLSGNHSAKDALQTRELFKNYFNSPEGSVPWQVDILREQ